MRISPSPGAGGFGVVVTFSSRFPVNVCCTIMHFISADVFAVVIFSLLVFIYLGKEKSKRL